VRKKSYITPEKSVRNISNTGSRNEVKQYSVNWSASPSLRKRAPLPSRRETVNFLESEISDVKISSSNDLNVESKSESDIPTGRSSTMPGFRNRNKSGRHESFKDGLSIARKSNTATKGDKIKKLLTSEKAVKKRTKANSEAMYASSVSVPDSMISFANQIHQVSRITPLEEKELGSQTQESIKVQNIYDKLESDLNREPTDAEWCAAAGKINMDAIQLVIDEGRIAKERLVLSNLRMVQGVVNLYIRNGLSSEFNAGDLMQEGTMALIRAAEKFQPQLGFRFSTYAMYWIRSSVKRSHTVQSRLVQVPQRLHETHKKVQNHQRALEDELGRVPTSIELANAVGISELQLERCFEAMAQQCFSLDASIENTLKPNSGDGRGSDSRYDLIDSKYGNSDGLESEVLKRDLIDTLRTYLSPDEADLILMRYGLLEDDRHNRKFTKPLTIAELSKVVGLKPDKVRRKISKSLKELQYMMSAEWKDYEIDLSTQ